MIPTPLRGCDRRARALDSEISAAERALGLTLPADYKAFLLETNGVEGFVSPEAYLILWAVLDVPSLNEAYAVQESLPGVTLIGTDGGDTGYGFKLREGHVEYVSTPLVGMEAVALRVMGLSFEQLVVRIRDGL